MATVKLIPPDLRELTSRIQEAERAFGNPGPLLKAWGVTILGLVDRNFRDGGNPKWQPLRPGTLFSRRWKKAVGRRGTVLRLASEISRGAGLAYAQTHPLQNTGALRRSFDFAVQPRRLTVFSRSPVAVWHEFGTKPYIIRPKVAKALIIPTGPFTLAGLGRSAPTGRGSFIFTPAKRQKRIPERLKNRIGKVVVPYENFIFRDEVHHPGLPARPMLPSPDQAIPALRQAADAFLTPILTGGRHG